jgi:hypothetical protein
MRISSNVIINLPVVRAAPSIVSLGIHRGRPCEVDEKQRHQDRLITQHFDIGVGGRHRALAPMHKPRVVKIGLNRCLLGYFPAQN